MSIIKIPRNYKNLQRILEKSFQDALQVRAHIISGNLSKQSKEQGTLLSFHLYRIIQDKA